MSYGNILSENLPDIWQEMSAWRQAQYIPDECQKCAFLAQCSGGCRMEAKYLGDICGRDPYMVSSQNVHDIPEKTPLSLVPVDQSYSLPKDIMFREEDFGGTLYSRRLGSLFVTHDSYVLLQALKPRDSFAVSELANETLHPIKSIHSFLSLLAAKEFITPLERR